MIGTPAVKTRNWTKVFLQEAESEAAMPLITSKILYVPNVQDAVTWRGRPILRDATTSPNALPAFTILQEEVSMISNCLTQGLLIAKNAG